MVGFVIIESLLYLSSWVSGLMIGGPEAIRSILYPASWYAERFDRFAKREDYIVRVLREQYPIEVRKNVESRLKQAIDLEKGRVDAAGALGTLFSAGALAVSALLFASDLPVLWKGIVALPGFAVTLIVITSKLGFVDLQQLVTFLDRAEDEDKRERVTGTTTVKTETGKLAIRSMTYTEQIPS